MKRFARQILSFVLAGETIFAPVNAFAHNAEAATQAEAHGPSITQINQSYELLTGDKSKLDVSVSGVEVKSPADEKEALAWFTQELAKAGGSAQKFALIPQGSESSDVPAGFEKLEIAPQEMAELAKDLSPQDASVARRLTNLTKRLATGRYSLAVIRAVGVGGAAYTGFMFSKLPLMESMVAAATIGFISGAIQYHVKWYTDFLFRQGGIVRGTQALAARIGSAFGLNYEKTKERLQKSMPFDFVFNQSTKVALMAAAILSIVNFEFFALNSPLQPDFWSTVSSVIVASIYTVTGQGALDTSIAANKEYAKKELGGDDMPLDSKAKALERLEITTSVKILSVALISNFASVLVSSTDPQAIFVGKEILNGVTLAGLTYWSFVLYRYNDWIRGKIKAGNSFCQRLLTAH